VWWFDRQVSFILQSYTGNWVFLISYPAGELSSAGWNLFSYAADCERNVLIRIEDSRTHQHRGEGGPAPFSAYPQTGRTICFLALILSACGGSWSLSPGSKMSLTVDRAGHVLALWGRHREDHVNYGSRYGICSKPYACGTAVSASYIGNNAYGRQLRVSWNL
jgi:hypothetical protein